MSWYISQNKQELEDYNDEVFENVYANRPDSLGTEKWSEIRESTDGWFAIVKHEDHTLEGVKLVDELPEQFQLQSNE